MTNKLLPCPECHEIGESLTEETFLTCPECGHEWDWKNPGLTNDGEDWSECG